MNSTTLVLQTLEKLTPSQRKAISGYLLSNLIKLEHLTVADIALAFLRMGDFATVKQLTGVTVKKLPACIPPWPPKPVINKPRQVVTRKKDAYLGTINARDRYSRVRLGMTIEQLRSRGVSVRDIKSWTNRGLLEFRP